jgi:NADH-quinone oxidoreductase subunit E
MFTLEEVACLGACSLAPIITLDGNVHGNMAPDGVGNIIQETGKHGSSK